MKGRLITSNTVKVLKIMKSFSPISKDFFTFALETGTRGHYSKLVHLHILFQAKRRFLSITMINYWKSLPSHVTEAPSLQTFKTTVTKYLGSRLHEYYGGSVFLLMAQWHTFQLFSSFTPSTVWYRKLACQPVWASPPIYQVSLSKTGFIGEKPIRWITNPDNLSPYT